MLPKPTFASAVGSGVGQMSMLLSAIVAFHFWAWGGLALYLVALTVIMLVAAAAAPDTSCGVSRSR